MNGLKSYWIIYNEVSSQIQTITLQDNDYIENDENIIFTKRRVIKINS
jgi:hypothetical protein